MNKKVSIILSTYNEASVIEDTINQIFKNLDDVEIILVDDNSPDGTYDIVKKINNPNIKVYLRKSRGLGSAFLLGLITGNNATAFIPRFISSSISFSIESRPNLDIPGI